MNERLKDLYLQAHSIRNYDGDPMRDGNPPDIYWQGEASAERFAELIIRECMQAVYDDGQDAEYYQNRIKQHFRS